jgi:hypothetical protein
MPTNKNSVYDEIFDVILTQALMEDCSRKVAFYKSMPDDHVFSEKFEKGVKAIQRQLKREERLGRFRKAAPKLATAAAILIMCTALVTNPAVSAFMHNIIVTVTNSEHSRHEFIDVEITAENFNHELRPAYLPQGYRIAFATYMSVSMFVEYTNELTLNYGIANSMSIGVDSNRTVQRAAAVNGREVFFYESIEDGWTNSLVWTKGGYS